jgi:malate dehydrogenase
MTDIGVVGSGNVGANTAFFIAERGVTDVYLYDIREGYSSGIALDIMEAAPIRMYRNKIKGVDSLSGLSSAETIIIAAGSVREPGMSREDLFEKNKNIIKDLAPRISEISPGAIVLVATEPVDICTTLFMRNSNHAPNKVMGLGGALDSARLRYMLARQLSVSIENVSALVIGRHSEDMIILPEYMRISGVPVTQLMDETAIEALKEETRRAGDLIVNLSQRASAYYAPSAVAAEIADSVHMNLKRLFSVSVYLQGQYGIHDVCMSLPAVIGKNGVEQVLTPRLKQADEENLRQGAEVIGGIVRGDKV